MAKGVLAWRFVETPTTVDAEEESNAAVMDESSSIVFCQGQGSIMTNLPVPIQEFSYWEVKVLKLDDQDRLAIGLATHPYPRWRLPGVYFVQKQQQPTDVDLTDFIDRLASTFHCISLKYRFSVC